MYQIAQCAQRRSFLLLLLVSVVSSTDAFVPRTFLMRNGYKVTPLQASDVSSAEAGESETTSPAEAGTGTLTFIAETVVRSDKVTSCTPGQMLEFMNIEENLASLLTAGATNPYEVVLDPSGELMYDWQQLAKELDAAEPMSSDRIFKVKTGGIQLPGLKLSSEVVIGAKIITADNKKDFPFYEFCLVTDSRSVEGPKPLVAIFNALTGANKKSKSRTSPTSLTRVTVETEEDGSILFQTAGFLKIVIKFPTFLFRILPLSKEKSEQQASAAIEKAIVRDTTVSTEYFRNKFEAWINTK